MSKTKTLSIIISFIIVSGLSFYIGSKYNKTSAKLDKIQQDQNINSQRRGGGMRNGLNGGFIGGSIVSIDNTSMTVSMRDGSSRVVLFSAATPVAKMVSGNSSDLIVGKEVTITGVTNPDGSFVAESISLRPTQIPNQKSN